MDKPLPFRAFSFSLGTLESRLPADTVSPVDVPDLRPLHRAVARVLGELTPAEQALLERRFGVRR